MTNPEITPNGHIDDREQELAQLHADAQDMEVEYLQALKDLSRQIERLEELQADLMAVNRPTTIGPISHLVSRLAHVAEMRIRQGILFAVGPRPHEGLALRQISEAVEAMARGVDSFDNYVPDLSRLSSGAEGMTGKRRGGGFT